MQKIGIVVIKICKRLWSILHCIIWKLLFGNAFHIGTMTFFYPNTHITVECGGKLKIGKNCFFNHDCSVTCLNQISIGNDCIFGESVKIYDHNHQYVMNGELFRKQEYKKGNVRIGNNCWIGSNTVILAGATIGSNVVIAAGSIVMKSIPDNTVVIQKRESDFLAYDGNQDYDHLVNGAE